MGQDITVWVGGLTLGGPQASDYWFETPTTWANINTRPITITPSYNSKTYDGTTTAAATPTITSGTLVGSDTVTGLSETYYSKNAYADAELSVAPGYTVNDGNGGNNYAVTLAYATGSIAPRPITVTAATCTKVYDGTTTTAATPTVTGGSLISGDTAAFTETYNTRNAGTRLTLTPTGSVNDGNGGQNYAVSLISATGAINQAFLTITAVANTKTYDGTTTAAARPSVFGLQGYDTVTGLAEAYADPNHGTNIPISLVSGYTVWDGNGGNNYWVIVASGAMGTINCANAEIDVWPYSVTYNGAPHTAMGSAMGVGGVNLSSELNLSWTTHTNAGMYEGMYDDTWSFDPDPNGNYYGASGWVCDMISPKGLTITAAANTKAYDGTTSAAAIPTVTGLQGSDTVTGLAEAYANPSPGTGKTLNVTGYYICDGNAGANYVVSLVSNTNGVILTATTTTVSTSEASAPYGTPVTFTATVTAQSGSIAPAGSVEFYDSTTSTYLGDSASPSTSNGTTSTWTFATGVKTFNVTRGDTITATYTGSGFSGSSGTTTETITPRPITVSAADASKVYDGTTSSTATPTITSGTLVGSDALAFIESFNTRNAGTGLTLTPTGSVNDGKGGNNYVVSIVANVAGQIAPLAITVTAAASTKVYDGTNSSAAVPTITPAGSLVSGDTAAFTETYNTCNAGTGLTLTPTGSVNDGNSGNNYSVTVATDTSGSITPCPTTTSVSESPNPSVYGQPASFTATVSAASSGGGVPTGSVDFYDGSTLLYHYEATLSDGPATFATSSLDVDGHNVSVVFCPDDGNFFGNTALVIDQEVDPAATATTITSAPSASVLGHSVTLTATVAATGPGAGTPTGSVDFYDGMTDLGTATLGGTSPYTATLTTSALPLGDQGIVAVYSGDGNFNGSNSPPVVDSVSPASVAAALPIILTGSDSVAGGSNYSLTLPAGYTSWTINWGDGSAPSTVSDPTAGATTATYAYEPGRYVITAMATNSAGTTYNAVVDNDDAAGGLDTSWGTGGTTVTDAGSLASVAVQPDGEIVAVPSNAADFPLVRYDSSGQPDGTVFDSISTSIATTTAVAIQPQAGDFNILAAGTGYAVACYNSDGTLDTTFGENGIASSNVWTLANLTPSRMLVQPDGSIVLVGLVPDGSGDDLVAVGYTAGGTQDGVATIPLDQAASSCDAATQTGGGIITAVGLGDGTVELTRLTPAGGQDTSFGSGGTVTASAMTSDPVLATLPDGSILLAGSNGDGGFALLQYPRDGGSPALTFDTSSVPIAQPAGMVVLPSGRIVLAGIDGSGQCALTAFKADGSLDTTFTNNSANGVIPTGMSGAPPVLALTAGGEILVAGSSVVAGSALATLACFASGGLGVQVTDVTTTFDPSGIASATVNVGQTYTLPPVAFDDADPLAWHTATVDWGDGTTDDANVDETPGETSGGFEYTGTLTDSHAYSQAQSTPYEGTVTVTDDSGVSTSENFYVTVLPATITLTDFAPSSDGAALDVCYTIANCGAAPLNIGIYTSADNATPDALLCSYEAPSAALGVGNHTVAIVPPTSAPAGNYYLIAEADTDPTPISFDGGTFEAGGTAYVFTDGHNVTIDSESIDYNDGQQSCSLTGITAIQVNTAGSSDTVTNNQTGQNAIPVSIYGGVGRDATMDLDIGAFTVDDAGDLSVTYTITGPTGQSVAPFTIGIYGSPGGSSPTLTELLQTYPVTDPSLLAVGGPYTVTFAASLGQLDTNCFLVADLDVYNQVRETTKTDNVSAPLSGVFQTGDGTVYAFTAVGSSSAADTVLVSQDPTTGNVTVGVNGVNDTFESVSGVTIATPTGDNTINGAVNGQAVTVPLTIYGGAGTDVITGGDGGDTIYGGAAGGSTIHGGNGGDTIYTAAAGGDTVHGGNGNDTIYGQGSRSNTITDGDGNDTIYAGKGGDVITDGNGNDQVFGGAGDDTITVGNGNDWVQGGGGDDSIAAGTGDDWLYGGASADTIIRGGDIDSTTPTIVCAENDVMAGAGTGVVLRGQLLDSTGGLREGTVYYGDGSSATFSFYGSVFAAPSHTYAADGVYDASVDVADADQQSASATYTAIVEDTSAGGDSVGIVADKPDASKPDQTSGEFTVYWNDLAQAATITVAFGGTAVVGTDYQPIGTDDQPPPGDSGEVITLPVSAGSGSQTYQVVPVGNGTGAGDSVVGASVSYYPNTGPQQPPSVAFDAGGDFVCSDQAIADETAALVAIHDPQAVPVVSIEPFNQAPAPDETPADPNAYANWEAPSQPVPIPVEGDGSDRVELQFYAALNSIYADASNWLASLSAPTGIEFWTSPTGGSSMTAAQVNATITAGPLNRDFWVSAATAGSQTSTITLNYVKTVGEVENASTFVSTAVPNLTVTAKRTHSWEFDTGNPSKNPTPAQLQVANILRGIHTATKMDISNLLSPVMPLVHPSTGQPLGSTYPLTCRIVVWPLVYGLTSTGLQPDKTWTVTENLTLVSVTASAPGVPADAAAILVASWRAYLKKDYDNCSGSQDTVGMSGPGLDNLLSYTLKSNEFWDFMAIAAPNIFSDFTVKLEQDFSATVPGTGTIEVLRQYIYWERKNGGAPTLAFQPINS